MMRGRVKRYGPVTQDEPAIASLPASRNRQTGDRDGRDRSGVTGIDPSRTGLLGHTMGRNCVM